MSKVHATGKPNRQFYQDSLKLDKASNPGQTPNDSLSNLTLSLKFLTSLISTVQ